jgi:hypothetical protein
MIEHTTKRDCFIGHNEPLRSLDPAGRGYADQEPSWGCGKNDLSDEGTLLSNQPKAFFRHWLDTWRGRNAGRGKAYSRAD